MPKSSTSDGNCPSDIGKTWKTLLLFTVIFVQGSLFAQYSDESVLSSGEIYKISTTQDGVYKIDYAFLKNQLGIDTDNLDPRNISLYGNGGRMLSEYIDADRIDDLSENDILVVGAADGQFDESDYILFYGQSADQKSWNAQDNRFSAPKNIYADEVYYYLKIEPQNTGARLSSAALISGSTYSSTSFDDYQRLEEEKVNLLDDFINASGTGQSWYGDLFKGVRSRTYGFDLSSAVPNETAHISAAFVSRSGTSSTVSMEVEGQSFSRLIGSVNLSDIEGRYARTGIIQGALEVEGDEIDIEISFPENSGNNIGWLDYIEINYRSNIGTSTGKPFSDQESINHSVSAFRIADGNNLEIWNISDPLHPISYTSAIISSGAEIEFSYESSELQTFIAFADSDLKVPKAYGSIPNQNLHGISEAEMIVLYHPDLIDAAELFVSHRTDISGISVEMVSVEEVYNEFGSGVSSPIAIRDFVKMIYDKSPSFKYLLLLGDASFDFKNIKGLSQNSNLVPTYETKESLDPIRGFPSDDFFGLLSPGEGGDLRGALDIAIGRLPAKDNSEALNMVNKIISYETSPDRFGDWMSTVTFVADDEDFNIHLNQADQIAERLKEEQPLYNVEKIYLDAFKQVSTAGGELYPDVQSAINSSLQQGTSVINYMGHGGSSGFAQERILTINDVNNWNNSDRLALFVTATCSFTGYDDPNIVTAGERAILNPIGGAIGLFTTVRAVYSSSNERLTKAVFDNLYKEVNGAVPPMGEILRIAKNSNAADTLGINARKFLLIGDPSLKLAQAKYNVVTTDINGQPINSGMSDTLKALDVVTIDGQIEDNGAIRTSFNGVVDIAIYDKPRSVTTLGQDNTSFERSFETQKNIIFKGNASVTDGTFSFSFVVPKDIDYQYGLGKISYFAQSNDQNAAAGYFDEIMIGGSSDSPQLDDQGPEIEIFMNDENFVNGGITSSNPTLLVNLKDDNGINIVGNSIGHDITAVLDNETSNTFILNEFYKSELDNTKVGAVRFPLSDITEGHHSIEVKAWDIANNSTTSSLDFVVATDAQSAIKRILNYPNPVTDQTSFRIDHNISDGILDITIDIFALDGKLVQSLKYTSGTSGGNIDNLQWDATDSGGAPLNTGIYLFQAIITDSNDPSKERVSSTIEKMVILQ